MWQTGSLPGSDDKWMAGMHGPEGAIGVWPRGSSPLHTPSGGLTLDHDMQRYTEQRLCRLAGSLVWWLQHLLTVEGVIMRHLADELIFLEILALTILWALFWKLTTIKTTQRTF